MRRLLFILLYFAIVATLFARNIPLFEASDEAEHFIYIQQILETGSLPIIQSREDMANQDNPILRWNNQSHHAPLYYLIAAGLVSWTERTDLADYLNPNELIFLRNTLEDNPNKWLHRYGSPTSDTHIAVYVLRGFSILIGMGTLCMVYYAAKQLNEGEGLAHFATLLTASIPTFIAVNASVSNDALVIFLYSAGIAWMLRVWRLQALRRYDRWLIGLILAGVSLTKLTGISLFGVIFLAVLWGAYTKRFRWDKALQTMITAIIFTAAFAGWWYFRNYQLYGDPFALSATASIWGREIPFTMDMLPTELLRIGKSFWMMVGYLHFPVLAPDWFYWTMAVLTLLGLFGLVVYSRKKPRAEIGLMLFACFVVIFMLLYGTRSVDISYGRLLLPAIAAFAPLLALGWRRLIPRFNDLLLLPLIGMAFYAPLVILPNAYPSLDMAETFPANAIPVNWKTGDLEIVAVAVPRMDYFKPNDTMSIDLYFRGNHPDNPALVVTAIDSIRTARLDHVEIYPGMADIRYLPDDIIYHLPVTFQLGRPDTSLPPRLIILNLEWVNLEDDTALVFDNGLSHLEIPTASFYDPAYKPEFPEGHVNLASFEEGTDIISLRDVTMPESAQAGETINLSFVWQDDSETLKINHLSDWTLTMQLFDSAGNFVSQSDGVMWWYPTSAWIPKITFEDIRSFILPADLPAGEYEMRLGWYREENGVFIRMNVNQGESIDNLLILPSRLVIE
jgi:hypothetical protein